MVSMSGERLSENYVKQLLAQDFTEMSRGAYNSRSAGSTALAFKMKANVLAN